MSDDSLIRVLFVEDNEINQELGKEFLTMIGYAVDVANNGQEAVTILTQGDKVYDAVLMDIHMPVMDGLEATRLIREDERYRTLPIISMSADVFDTLADIEAAGFSDAIYKPINIEILTATLEKWTQSQS